MVRSTMCHRIITTYFRIAERRDNVDVQNGVVKLCTTTRHTIYAVLLII